MAALEIGESQGGRLTIEEYGAYRELTMKDWKLFLNSLISELEKIILGNTARIAAESSDLVVLLIDNCRSLLGRSTVKSWGTGMRCFP